MVPVEDILAPIRRNPKGVRFPELCPVSDFFFGKASQRGRRHRLYQTPWPGDPRGNIQHDTGMATASQVRQVLKAIERLEARRGTHA